ncbi:hypothetical protein VSP20_12310 [Myroides phaeus]|uniref:hypothetical protein n=1 Tax=Myroides phaeus TaxID=702745 RepID=UPI002DBEC425|nr:hypothetical protein [Myroides phaeus]MEC4117746.1 hypothetical protein [Myroides phaeus]
MLLIQEYSSNFDNGAPKVVNSSIAIYDNMNKIDTYNSYFFTAVISEMIEQIKEGL